MKRPMKRLVACCLLLLFGVGCCSPSFGQNCTEINGNRICYPPLYSQPSKSTRVSPLSTAVKVPCKDLELLLDPLNATDAASIDLTAAPIAEASGTADRFDQVTSATVRVTVSGVCGSGTVVGRDKDGAAIVLTNAHVAGTQRGRTCNVQRWNPDGSSEKGTGQIISSGYGRGLSVDFALLRCNAEFAKSVVPVPLADRYPVQASGVTTFGCPRCEWPSLQVLRLTKAEGQVLRWLPEAIGGRSGSSLIDYTENGPRVVGLLTWGGGGEGLGQSTPFLLDAMRGRMPKAFEELPAYAQELREVYRQMPCSLDGTLLAMQLSEKDETSGETEPTIIDSITERGPDAKPEEDSGIFRRPREKDPATPSDDAGLIRKGPSLRERVQRILITFALCTICAVVGFVVGRLTKK